MAPKRAPQPRVPSLREVDSQSRAVKRAARKPVEIRSTTGTLTKLESYAVSDRTENDYQQRVARFLQWCLMMGLSWACTGGLDLSLTLFMNAEFEDGADGEEGSKLLAGVKHYLQELTPLSTHLPRATRALTGWKKLAPSKQGLPLPRAALGAIMGAMMWEFVMHNMRGSQMEMVIALYLSFICYLRPCELICLRRRHVVRPVAAAGTAYQAWGLLLGDSLTGIPGKTGIFDESVLIDHDNWLHPHLLALSSAGEAHEPVWTFSRQQLTSAFSAKCEQLNLSPLKPRLYALRHGGASDDLMTRRRAALDVQKRGRWSCLSSLKRYGKETRILTEIEKCPTAVITYGSGIIDRLAESVSFPALVPAPPPQPAGQST